jgi:hypothetical protein
LNKTLIVGMFSNVSLVRPSLAPVLCAGLLATPSAARSPDPFNLAPEALGPTAYLADQLEQGKSFHLAVEQDLALLQRYVEPKVERAGEWRRFFLGRYGPRMSESALAWSASSCASPVDELPTLPGLGAWSLRPVELASPRLQTRDLVPTWALDVAPAPAPGIVLAAPRDRCAPWQRPYTVTVARYGGEAERFVLLDCDGSVAIDGMDHLSVLSRPPGTPRPELPLPLEPTTNDNGEWLPQVKLLHPRLAWVVASISSAFPGRVIYVISGYRRDAHDNFHKLGRALDLFVMGVENEDLYRFCRRLKDVACGYYPKSRFVHVDVRPPFTGHTFWVDASAPGQPARYVDGSAGIMPLSGGTETTEP